MELGRKLILSGLIGVVVKRGTVAQTVLACFVSFFFFAVFYRAQPFVDPTLNAIKGVSEFIIFGVLLACTVQQTAATTTFEQEPYQIADYGMAQTCLCLMYLPVVIVYGERNAHAHKHTCNAMDRHTLWR